MTGGVVAGEPDPRPQPPVTPAVMADVDRLRLHSDRALLCTERPHVAPDHQFGPDEPEVGAGLVYPLPAISGVRGSNDVAAQRVEPVELGLSGHRQSEVRMYSVVAAPVLPSSGSTLSPITASESESVCSETTGVSVSSTGE